MSSVRIWIALVILTFAPTARADDVSLQYSIVEGAGGVPLLVAETGNPNGPELLLVHGMSQSHLAWMSIYRSDLAKSHRIVAFDLRGQGGSGKPWREQDYAGPQVWADDVAAVIKAKKLARPVLVTWSFGGHVALAYVRQYGTTHVGGVLLAGTLGGLVKVEREMKGPQMNAIMAGSKLRRDLDLRQNIEGYLEMPKGFTAKPLDPETQQIAAYTGLMHPSYVRRAMTKLPLDNTDLVSKVDVPVTIVVGSLDNEWPVAAAEEAKQALPRARLSVYQGAGHMPFVEDAPRFERDLEALSAAAQSARK